MNTTWRNSLTTSAAFDPHIMFTIVPEKDSKLPFLDLCTHILDDGSTKITIYRTLTHADQLQVTSPSNAQTLSCTYPHQQGTAMSHSCRQEIRTGTANGYPEWALSPAPPSAKIPPSTNNNPRRPMLGLPYVAGLSEQLGRIYFTSDKLCTTP